MKIAFTIHRRLPKAPRPEKSGRPIGTRKGAMGYNRSDNKRAVERATKGGDLYEGRAALGTAHAGAAEARSGASQEAQKAPIALRHRRSDSRTGN